MLILFFIFTTILFGSAIVLLIKQRLLHIMTHLSIGWLIGAMLTGFISFIRAYFAPITVQFVYVLIILHIIIVILAITAVYFNSKEKFFDRMKIAIEQSQWLHITVAIVLMYAIYTNFKFFNYFPTYVPATARYDVEMDHTIMVSMVSGINGKRKSFFSLQDPMQVNGTYYGSFLAHSYIACLLTTRPKFHDISIIVSFFNILTSTIALFQMSSHYHQFQAFSVLAILLNGGWAFFRQFTVKTDQADLIHNVGREYHVPMYQIFFQFLVASKSFSFAFPIAIYTIGLLFNSKATVEQFQNYMLAGILIALCPSFMTAMCLGIFAMCQLYAIFFTVPFLAFLGWKWYNTVILTYPVWREYQMNGIFFAQICSWLDAFGPFFFVIILSPFYLFNAEYFHKLVSALCALCFVSFFRSGNYIYENAFAAAATVLPILVNIAFNMFQTNLRLCKGRARGFLISFFVLIVATSIYGGHKSNMLNLIRVTNGLDKDGAKVAQWAVQHVPMNETVMSVQMPFNPISFCAGRSIYSSMPNDLWIRGGSYASVTANLRLIDQLGGAPNLMRTLKLKYLLEYSPVPLVSRDRKLLEQYMILEGDEKWTLMKLINQEN